MTGSLHLLLQQGSLRNSSDCPKSLKINYKFFRVLKFFFACDRLFPSILWRNLPPQNQTKSIKSVLLYRERNGNTFQRRSSRDWQHLLEESADPWLAIYSSEQAHTDCCQCNEHDESLLDNLQRRFWNTMKKRHLRLKILHILKERLAILIQLSNNIAFISRWFLFRVTPCSA